MGNKRDRAKHIETEEWATAKGGAWAPREAGSAGLSERRASLACRTFRERGEPRPAHSAVSSPRALCSFHLRDTLANGLRVPPSLNQETGGGPAEPSWPVGTRSQSETARFRRPCSADCRARLGCRRQTCRPAKSRGRCSWSVSHWCPQERGGEELPGRHVAFVFFLVSWVSCCHLANFCEVKETTRV